MKKVDIGLVKKFWSIMGSLERGNSTLYEGNKCQRDIFVRRVIKIMNIPKYCRVFLNEEMYVMCPFRIAFAYANNDKLTISFISAKTNQAENITVQYNGTLGLCYEEISPAQFEEITNINNGSVAERFLSAYSSCENFFKEYSKEILEHPTTAIIYERLSNPVNKDILKGIVDLMKSTQYWDDDSWFYINENSEIRKSMPAGKAWLYLTEVKSVLVRLGFITPAEIDYNRKPKTVDTKKRKKLTY